MEEKSEDSLPENALVAEALRKIRKARRLRTSEVARAMGMPLRSYEHLEAGQGKITYDRLKRFAEVANCDPVALLAVVPMGSVEFAEVASEELV